MNTHDDLDLLRRLKALPREREPGAATWAGIEARLGAGPAKRAPRGWMIGLALAASAALVAVLATRVPESQQARVAQIVSPAPPRADDLVRRQAEAITLEYRLALQSFAGEALPPELEPAAVELDDSAQRIRAALREEPGAVYLLDRLRQTYDQRLKLSQRALVG